MGPSKSSNLGQIIEYIPGTFTGNPRLLLPPLVLSPGDVLQFPTTDHKRRPTTRSLCMDFIASCHPYRSAMESIHNSATGPTDTIATANAALTYHCLFQSVPIVLLTYSQDRLYLASYIHPPTEETLFPYPEAPIRSPSKRSQRAGHGPQAVSQPAYKQPYYFSVDDTLLYNNFHHDFGPFHIGHLYRFALQFHEILGAKENKDRPVVFWSRADPRSECPQITTFVRLSKN